MGNALVHTSASKPDKKSLSMFDFYRAIMSSQVGETLMACSFGRWCRHQQMVCGFSDKASYGSMSQVLTHSGRSSSVPDTTDGRYFQAHFKERHEIVIYEKQSGTYIRVKVPRFSSQSLSNFLHRRDMKFNVRQTQVVAYHKGTIVVQVNTHRTVPYTKFYIIDMEAGVCTGHFIVANNFYPQFEVHISPSASHIVLRPDAQYMYQVFSGYNIQSGAYFPPCQALILKKIPENLFDHSIVYNALLGDEHILVAHAAKIKTYRTSNWTVESTHNIGIRDALIHQIRSSPSGNFLAVRFTFPGDGYHYNHILVCHYPQFSIIMQVDVRGAYWPVSELVNLKVFPRFSLSESCLAVMKQQNFGRKVFVYKLPVELNSLQDLCRRAILHLVAPKDISKLPLPPIILRYLNPYLE